MFKMPRPWFVVVEVIAIQMALVAGGWAQETVAPTSVPLEETLQPIFKRLKGPCEVKTAEAYSNFRVVLDYDATESAGAKLVFGGEHAVSLPPGEDRRVEVAYEHFGATSARVRIWEEGKLVEAGA